MYNEIHLKCLDSKYTSDGGSNIEKWCDLVSRMLIIALQYSECTIGSLAKGDMHAVVHVMYM